MTVFLPPKDDAPHRELSVDGFKRAAKRLRYSVDVPHAEALERLARACGFDTYREVAIPARVFRVHPARDDFRDALGAEWGAALAGWTEEALADMYDNIFRVVFTSPKDNYKQEQRVRGLRQRKQEARAQRRRDAEHTGSAPRGDA